MITEKLIINPLFKRKDTEKGIIFFNPKNGEFYNINTSGADFIKAMDGERTYDQILRLLCQDYEIDKTHLSEQLDSFLQKLKKLSILL